MAIESLVGNNGLLYVDVGGGDYQLVALQRGLTHEQTRDIIDASHKGSDHMQSVYGRQGGTISLDALVPSPDFGGAVATHGALYAAQNNKQTVIFQLVQRDSGDGSSDRTLQAEALVGTISSDYPDNDVATLSTDITLQEALTEV